jgi:hypothetical protein
VENHQKIHESLEFLNCKLAKGRCKLASGCWQTTHHPAKICHRWWPEMGDTPKLLKNGEVGKPLDLGYTTP